MQVMTVVSWENAFLVATPPITAPFRGTVDVIFGRRARRGLPKAQAKAETIQRRSDVGQLQTQTTMLIIPAQVLDGAAPGGSMFTFVKTVIRCGVPSLLLLGLGAPTATSAAGFEQAPFSGVAGSWSGDGTIAMSNGTKEKIRCRATYSIPALPDALNQSLRCASDSYQFDVQSHVQATPDGGLTGSWSEAVHGVSGDVSGRVAAGRIDTSVEAFGFSARLSVATQGRRQSVSILPDGGDVESVTIVMQRI